MSTRVAIAAAVGLIVIVGAVIFGSRATASSDSDKTEIIALNQRLVDAFNKRDVDAAMSCYVEDKDAVFFYDTIPFQLEGKSALRKLNQDFYKRVSQFRARAEAISVVVSGDLAAAHYQMPIDWSDNGGAHSMRAQYTQVLKKIGGKWLVWHEHLSLPFDPATGKAVFEAKP